MALSDIRTAWQENIFEHATVQAWTEQILDYEITQEYQREVVQYMQDAVVNFFTYTVSRSRLEQMSNRALFSHIVTVKYYLEVDPSSVVSTHNTILDRLETFDSLVISQLGRTWDSTVDYYTTQDSPIEISQIKIEDRPTLFGQLVYTGIKTAENV